MFNTSYVTVNNLMVENLYVPYTIVFPGVPIMFVEDLGEFDPDDTRTVFALLTIEEMVDEAAESAERYGYTTYEDEYVDIGLF